jgi:hypothetical protein
LYSLTAGCSPAFRQSLTLQAPAKCREVQLFIVYNPGMSLTARLEIAVVFLATTTAAAFSQDAGLMQADAALVKAVAERDRAPLEKLLLTSLGQVPMARFRHDRRFCSNYQKTRSRAKNMQSHESSLMGIWPISR